MKLHNLTLQAKKAKELIEIEKIYLGNLKNNEFILQFEVDVKIKQTKRNIERLMRYQYVNSQQIQSQLHWYSGELSMEKSKYYLTQNK